MWPDSSSICLLILPCLPPSMNQSDLSTHFLSTYPPTFLPIHPPTQSPTNPVTQLSTFIQELTYPSIHPPIPVYLCNPYLSIHSSTYLPTPYLPTHSCISYTHPSIHLSAIQPSTFSPNLSRFNLSTVCLYIQAVSYHPSI